MVFAVGDVQFESFQLDTSTQSDAGTMAAHVLAIAHTHLVGATEIIAGT